MIPFKDKRMPVRIFFLTILRVSIKLIMILVALFLQVPLNSFLLLLGIILFSELYNNVGTYFIIRGVRAKDIGPFISALDGAILVLALYFAYSLNSDLYLFVILSTALNAVEYGLLSAVVEGIIAGFSYGILVLSIFGYADRTYLFSTYMIRVVFLSFFGWLIGWITSDLHEKEGKLALVLESDIHEQELNYMKDAFLKDAGENIQTPISAIKGYIDLIRNGRVGEVSDVMKKYLENIQKNLFKIEVFAGDLLHFINIENDSIVLKKKSSSVLQFVNSIKNDITAFSRVFKTDVIIQDDLKSDAEIDIDENRLRIGINNILYYIMDQTNDHLTIQFKKDAENLEIGIIAVLENVHILDILNDSSDTFKNDTSLLKVYTSKLIIESHSGKVIIEKQDANMLNFVIVIPFISDDAI